jgi:hypothetical protein
MGNTVPESMVAAEKRLEQLSEVIVRDVEIGAGEGKGRNFDVEEFTICWVTPSAFLIGRRDAQT